MLSSPKLPGGKEFINKNREYCSYPVWGQWDPTQAKHLLDEMKETGFIDEIWGFELGNEIYGSHGVQVLPLLQAKNY